MPRAWQTEKGAAAPVRKARYSVRYSRVTIDEVFREFSGGRHLTNTRRRYAARYDTTNDSKPRAAPSVEKAEILEIRDNDDGSAKPRRLALMGSEASPCGS
ncbi:hypothetical protein MRX96_042260 [Rhipicephalus microplus]